MCLASPLLSSPPAFLSRGSRPWIFVSRWKGEPRISRESLSAAIANQLITRFRATFLRRYMLPGFNHRRRPTMKYKLARTIPVDRILASARISRLSWIHTFTDFAFLFITLAITISRAMRISRAIVPRCARTSPLNVTERENALKRNVSRVYEYQRVDTCVRVGDFFFF